ncbi:hypothetical protein D9M68_444850 [compost metagenome]
MHVVTIFDGFEHLGVKVDTVRSADKGLDVFRKAGTAVTGTGVYKVIANTRVRADALANHLDIGTQLFCQVSHFVHKADLGGKHAVSGVLCQFGAAHIHDNDLFMVAVEGRVELAHYLFGFLAAGTNDDAVGAHAIGNRRAFLEEFGVGNHIKGQVLAPAHRQYLCHTLANLVGGTNRNSRFVDDDLVAFHIAGDGFRHGQHVLEVSGAVFVWRGADCYELDFAMLDA